MELFGFSEDPDKLFSYNTKQQVEVQNKWIGLINSIMQTTMVVYIVFGIFISGQAYLDYEPSRGATATLVHGDLVAVSSGKAGSRYFSAEEITYPGLENGNVFVTTKKVVTRQKRGVCKDKLMPCTEDSDCHAEVDGLCTEGFCVESSWCPAEADDEIYELDVSDIQIWVKSSVQFVGMAPGKIWSTEIDHALPEAGYNLFTVRELLLMVQPTPVRFEEIKDLGAAIEVQFIWSCHVAFDECKPEVKVRRLDILFDADSFGYFFFNAEYVSDDERFLNQNTGVRIFLRTVGTGMRLNVVKLIMKASTAGTLLTIAPLVADLLMLRVFANARKYFARKYEVSPDFSEYMESLTEKMEAEKNRPGALQEDDDKQLAEDEEWRRKYNE